MAKPLHSDKSLTIRVYRENLNDFFLISPNDLHRGEEVFAGMTLRGRALLAALLSMKDGWECNREAINELAPELGEAAMDTVIRELRDRRHLAQRRIRGERGRFVWEWYVFMFPLTPARYEAVCAGRAIPQSSADGEVDGETAGDTMGQSSTDGRPLGGEIAGHTTGDSPGDGRPQGGGPGDGQSPRYREVTGVEAPPPPPPAATGSASGPTQVVVDSDQPPEDQPSDDDASALVDELPWGLGRQPDRLTRPHLVAAVQAGLHRGHPLQEIRQVAAAGIPGAVNPAGSVLRRLRDLAEMPPAPPRPRPSPRPQRHCTKPGHQGDLAVAGNCAFCKAEAAQAEAADDGPTLDAEAAQDLIRAQLAGQAT
jgi:hypothetical protein